MCVGELTCNRRRRLCERSALRWQVGWRHGHFCVEAGASTYVAQQTQVNDLKTHGQPSIFKLRRHQTASRRCRPLPHGASYVVCFHPAHRCQDGFVCPPTCRPAPAIGMVPNWTPSSACARACATAWAQAMRSARASARHWASSCQAQSVLGKKGRPETPKMGLFFNSWISRHSKTLWRCSS